MEDIREMLKKVAAGELSVDNAVLELKKEPFTAAGYDDLGFAKLDTHRKLRQGAAEVIYGAGKTPEQIAGIVEAMKKRGQETILITRVDEEKMIAGGKVSTNDIAGPVRIVTIIDQTVEENTQYGFVTVVMNLLNLMVMFSANLGVMNLLPFPALDGGRLVFLLWELVTRQPVSQRVESAVNMAGMALLMTFMVFVVFNDLRMIF